MRRQIGYSGTWGEVGGLGEGVEIKVIMGTVRNVSNAVASQNDKDKSNLIKIVTIKSSGSTAGCGQ